MTSSWACFLQKFSSPVLDEVVYLITLLGSEGFFMVVLPILYWTWDKRAGYRITLLFLVSGYVNSFLKLVVHTPRPTPTECSRVMHPETGGGYAFPSGHAQGTTVFWGQASVEIRRRGMWVAAVIVTVLVSLSRVYLNVHWPIDIIGGISIGIVILVFGNAVLSASARRRCPLWVQLACSIGIPLILYFVHPQRDAVIVGFLMGLTAGHALEDRYVGWNEHASLRHNVLKVLLGLGVLAGIRYGLKPLLPVGSFSDLLRYAVAGFWASLGAPGLFAKMGWFARTPLGPAKPSHR